MVYKKPEIISPSVINGAVCGSGPCGRPCSNKA